MDRALGIADAKNAFCQSNIFVRPWGAIFVEARSGLGLLGEPNRARGPKSTDSMMRRSSGIELVQNISARSAFVLVEVGGLIVSGDAKVLPVLKGRLLERLKLGVASSRELSPIALDKQRLGEVTGPLSAPEIPSYGAT
eukprot:8775906-Pyramimonas_sp.AAC.1